jgi:hypothetical protein
MPGAAACATTQRSCVAAAITRGISRFMGDIAFFIVIALMAAPIK